MTTVYQQSSELYEDDEVVVTSGLPPRSFEYVVSEHGTTPTARVISPSELSPDQRDAFDRILRWAQAPDRKVLSLGGYAGTGKALDLNTPIATPEGWTTMGALKVGDYVFAPDGTPTRVTFCSEVQRERECFDVVFADGARITADADHLWVTFTRHERARLRAQTPEQRARRRAARAKRSVEQRGDDAAFALREPRPCARLAPITGKARTTRAIAETVFGQDDKRLNHSVPMHAPLVLPERELLIDPYVLGLWLGDGAAACGRITKPDVEVYEALEKAGYQPHRLDGGVSITIATYGLQTQLRQLRVLSNKHIPETYLRASLEQRLALAQGLMDTDGYADPKTGAMEFTSTNERLALDMWDLLTSLGCRMNITEGEARLNGRLIGAKYRIAFMSPLPMFRLPRKLANQKREGFRATHDYRYIKAVVPTKSVPVRCIQVAHPSHCYLAGYEMVVTHNTTLTSTVANVLCNEMGRQVAFLTPTAKAGSVLQRKLAPLNIPTAFCGTVHSFMYTPILDEKEELVGWGRRFFERIKEADGTVSYIAKGKKSDLPKLHLIIVDEASMVNGEMEDDILAFGIPVLAVGDHGQLPPVQGISTWMQDPDIRLEKIHRQAEDNPILAVATFVRERGYLPPGIENFGIPYFRSLGSMESALLNAYEARGQHEVALICYTNRLRADLNIAVHRELFGDRHPTRGSQVICLKNDRPLINGMRGHIVSDVEQRDIWSIARVSFPDANLIYDGPFLSAQFGVAKVPKNLDVAEDLVGRRVRKLEELGAFFDYGYAMTAHKAQGSQFQEVFVVLEGGRRPNDYPRWLYTAITRASERLSFCETWG
jgi:hypothetical protein